MNTNKNLRLFKPSANFALMQILKEDVTAKSLLAHCNRQQGYCLWGTCAFHFTNAPSFATLPCDKSIAQGIYTMRKMTSATLPPTATLYVYVRILQQPVSLPDKRTMVMRPGTSFDFEWSTLRKEIGRAHV